MGKREKAIMAVGAVLFFIGGAGIDSPNQLVPCAMALAGVGLMWSIGHRYAE